MRKLVYALAILFSVVVLSCGNAETTTDEIDSVENTESTDTSCILSIDTANSIA